MKTDAEIVEFFKRLSPAEKKRFIALVREKFAERSKKANG